ncbi:MAG: hypothetical protein MN733_44085 [Nitrososphaera sp.]|nr:hypothetical protein [Nitrososphaera sp.]
MPTPQGPEPEKALSMTIEEILSEPQPTREYNYRVQVVRRGEPIRPCYADFYVRARNVSDVCAVVTKTYPSKDYMIVSLKPEV